MGRFAGKAWRAGLCFFALAAVGRAEERRNILFIAVDDLKPALGCYGDERAITPHIDRLAARGTLFSRAYVQQAVCGPSRASLMTGLRPDRTEVWDLKTRMRDRNPDILTLPQHLRRFGYETVGYGKIFDTRCVDEQLDAPSWSQPFKLGYQLPYPEGVERPVLSAFQSPRIRQLVEAARSQGLSGYGPLKRYLVERDAWPAVESVDVSDLAYTDSAIAEAGKRSLRGFAESGERFFLAVGFKKPHLPFIAPQAYWDLYDRSAFEPHPFQRKSASAVEAAYHSSGELRSYSGIPDFDSYAEDPADWMPADKQRELMHGYYACVSYIDALIGGLLAELEAVGLKEETVVVLWGDHGWHLGDHGLWCKHSNFEQATRAPLIFAEPGGEAGAVASGPVEFVDVFPTLCELAGAPVPQGLDGRSLAAMVRDGEARARAFAVSQWPVGRSGMGYAIRDDRYRYVEWMTDGDTKQAYDGESVFGRELYDYERDPLETVNVAADPAYGEVAARMAERMRALFAEP